MNWLIEIWDDHFWVTAACVCAIVVVVSSLAERRRNKRTRIEDVGFMPWTGITVLSVLLTVLAIAFAIKSEAGL
jgi:multisubunit Na+/H+ antiporter MnhB subunit